MLVGFVPKLLRFADFFPSANLNELRSRTSHYVGVCCPASLLCHQRAELPPLPAAPLLRRTGAILFSLRSPRLPCCLCRGQSYQRVLQPTTPGTYPPSEVLRLLT